jgi:hypothetical protein
LKKNGTTPAPSWAAIATVDLATASSTAFAEAVAKIDAEGKRLRKAGELPDIAISTGVTKFTPEDAQKALLHNGGNRKVKLSHVQACATLMQMRLWKLAQPVLFDEADDLIDGQHRLLAILFAGLTIDLTTMIVPVQKELFACVDAGVGRSATDTLFTAGMDGASASSAGAAKLLWRYENKTLSCSWKQPKVRKISNMEVLAFVQARPAILDAAHEVSSEYPSATSVIGDAGVATSIAYLVNEHYEDGALRDFLGPLGTGIDLADDDPIAGLRLRLNLAGTAAAHPKLNNAQKLAMCLKAFNMEVLEEKLGKRGLFLRDNEPFPRIDSPESDTDKAA